jgi:hypothetical protein
MDANPYESPKSQSSAANKRSLGDIVFYAVAIFTGLFLVSIVIGRLWISPFMPL